MNGIGKSTVWLALVAGGLVVLSGCDRIHEARSRQLIRSAHEHYRNRDFDKALEISEVALRLGAEFPSLFAMRGAVYVFQRKPEEALAEFNRGLDAADAADGEEEEPVAPELISELFASRGNALEALGKYREALESFQKAVEASEGHAGAHNNIAWIFATIPLDSLRDGPKAVKHATRACELSDWENAAFLDTMAAACAEAGDFKDAEKWQLKASEFLDKDDEINREGFESRLLLYRNRKPYREDPKTHYAEMIAREKEAGNPLRE